MRLLRLIVLYTALAFGANAALADTTALEALRDGSLRKLSFHAQPKPLPDVTFLTLDDSPQRLSELYGKYMLINFWATWCDPCRREMAGLNRLQLELGGDDFGVVAIATGPNPLPAVKKFLAEYGIDDLHILRDPNQELARQVGVMALPVSILVDPEGREIARLIGDAEWDSDSARAIVAALIAQGGD